MMFHTVQGAPLYCYTGDKAFDAEDYPEPSALPGVQVVRIQ